MRLSYGSISLLHDCGIAFENRYVKNIQTPRSISVVVGTAVDAAVNADLGKKSRTGSLLAMDEIYDIVAGRIAEEFGRYDIQINESDSGWMASRGGALDSARRMAALHHVEVAPHIEPIAVQRYWELEYGGFILNGYIDIQENGCVRDTKTSYRSPDKNSARESKQLTMYAWALWKIDGVFPEKVVLDFLVNTPVRSETKLVQLESQRDAGEVTGLTQWIDYGLRAVKSGVFRPAETGHWMCQKKYCGYWASCPHAQGKSAAAHA